jgi:hypothetical protein
MWWKEHAISHIKHPVQLSGFLTTIMRLLLITTDQKSPKMDRLKAL